TTARARARGRFEWPRGAPGRGLGRRASRASCRGGAGTRGAPRQACRRGTLAPRRRADEARLARRRSIALWDEWGGDLLADGLRDLVLDSPSRPRTVDPETLGRHVVARLDWQPEKLCPTKQL